MSLGLIVLPSEKRFLDFWNKSGRQTDTPKLKTKARIENYVTGEPVAVDTVSDYLARPITHVADFRQVFALKPIQFVAVNRR
jgi:hypothetical protein